MKPDAATYIDALHRLEQSRDVDTIAGLFADSAGISNPLVAQGGKDGAASFWTAYRSTFDEIESSFAVKLEQDGRIALEWKSTGTVKGRDVAYEGVSILEVGAEGITAFRTYFDTAALGLELTQRAA